MKTTEKTLSEEQAQNLNTRIMDAIQRSNDWYNGITISKAKTIIDEALGQGADINRINLLDNEAPVSPFIIASDNKNYEMIEYLLEKGLNQIIDLNFYNYIKSGHYLKTMMANNNYGFVPATGNPLSNLLAKDQSPLFLKIFEIIKNDVARIEGDMQLIISNALIQNGHNASIDTLEFLKENNYKLPIEMLAKACENDNKESIQYLIKQDLVTNDYKLPIKILMEAYKNDSKELIQYLIKYEFSGQLSKDEFGVLLKDLKYDRNTDPIETIKIYKKIYPDFLPEFEVERLSNNPSGKQIAWLMLREEQQEGGLNITLPAFNKGGSLVNIIIQKLAEDFLSTGDSLYSNTMMKIFDSKYTVNEDLKDTTVEYILTGELFYNNVEGA